MPEDEGNLIHGLELQGRALAAVQGDSDTISFLVGTQSLRHDNMLYKITLDEDTGQLGKEGYKHLLGEVWHLDTSPASPHILATTYGEKSPQVPGGWRKGAAICSIPTQEEQVGEGEGSLVVKQDLSPLLGKPELGEVSKVAFQPSEGGRVVCVAGDRLLLGDIEANTAVWTARHQVRGQASTSCVSWNSHRNCHQVASATGSQVIGWDSRTGEQAWILQTNTTGSGSGLLGGGGGHIRALDFNRNKQYYLATGINPTLLW